MSAKRSLIGPSPKPHASDWPTVPMQIFSFENALGEWPRVEAASGESDWSNSSGRFILIGCRPMPGVRVRWRRKSSARRHHLDGGRYP